MGLRSLLPAALAALLVGLPGVFGGEASDLRRSAAAGAEPAAGPLPRLLLDAPEQLSGVAAEVASWDRERLRVAMRLSGLTDPGPPIRVYLAPEGSEAARRVPSWVAGYASGAGGWLVLLPARSPTWPTRSLEAVLHHEVAHVLIARAARGRPVPRWFDEGVAMAAARAWNLEDRTRFAWYMLSAERLPLARLDGGFAGNRAAVARAYALAGAFVRDLLGRHGPGMTGEILTRIGRGAPFAEAFAGATGESLAGAEARFWQRHGGWHRWVPLVTSSLVLWMAVTALALLAMWRRRLRDAELHRRWEEEEERAWREARRRAEREHDEWVN